MFLQTFLWNDGEGSMANNYSQALHLGLSYFFLDLKDLTLLESQIFNILVNHVTLEKLLKLSDPQFLLQFSRQNNTSTVIVCCEN